MNAETSLTTLKLAVDVVNAIGSIGLLVGMIYALLKGIVVPMWLVEKMLKSADQRTEMMAKELQEGFAAAVREAVLEAITEARRRRRNQ